MDHAFGAMNGGMLSNIKTSLAETLYICLNSDNRIVISLATKLGGYIGFTLSVRLSVWLSVR